MFRPKPKVVSIIPQPELPPGLDSPNVFRDKFGDLRDDDWLDILIRALATPVIDGVQFPQYPDAELQNRIHGYADRHAMQEAFDFYQFIKSREYLRGKLGSGSYFLDFAAGWGRMSRPFLRDFDLDKIFAYEPNRAFCVIARTLNPYICFLNGDFFPDNTLPQNRFDLVIGYSIFTHLSEPAAVQWLAEMARVTRPGAYCVFTTWGRRFLDRLIEERDALAEGKEVHWYSKQCLEAAGEVEQLRDRYRDGSFVWFSGIPGGSYGEAFIPPSALTALLRRQDIPLELVDFDQDNLAQDVLVLRRADTQIAAIAPRAVPQTAEQLARAASAAMEQRDWDEAIHRWEAVRANTADRADSYIGASHALREIRRLDEAEALSREAIARFPDSPDARTAHAWVAMTREDWDEALRRWEAARDLAPDRADVYVWPAHALWRAGRFDEADAMSREGLARHPGDADALTQHAWVAMGRRDWDEALRRWQSVRERFPQREEAHAWPIRALRTLRRFDEAAAMAAETLTRFPHSRVALVERIMTAAERGDWDGAAAFMAETREALSVDGRIDPELSWIDYRLRRMAEPRAAEDTESGDEPGALSATGNGDEESPTFCTHLWSQLRIEGGGEAKVCCAYEGPPIAENGQPMSVERHALRDIWNSAEMRGLRRDMIAGRRVPGCRQCYTDEARGGVSMRMRDNASWKEGWLNPANATIPQIAAQAMSDDYHVAALPTLVEIEIGNLCNFKCRTCSGNLSSLIAKDPVHEAWAAGRGLHIHDPASRPGPYQFRPAASIARVGEELERDTDGQIRRLYFIGGEPLMIREIGMLLQRLVSSGRSRNIELQFITNGSMIPRWLPLAAKFRRVDLTVSVDGHGAHYDYIRYPGKWPELVENLKTFRATENLSLYVSSTIQINNALNITKLFRYLDSEKIGFTAYFLHWPHYLAAGFLPPALRRLAAERLRDYADGGANAPQRALALSLAAQFEAGGDEVDARLLRDFMLFTNDLDATRGQNIREADPELVELLAQAGYPWTDERLHAAANRPALG
jgi:tetratricopeptide (TPR) repeat protein/MoaA/NifB/PqqE/SkfB family radical SAM enzyme